MSKYKRGLELVNEILELLVWERVKVEGERDEMQAKLTTKQAELDALIQMQTDLLKDKQKLEKP